MELISLKADFAAKELFAHEKVRKQFLSDTLGIPLEDIRSVRLVNPFLRRWYRRQKHWIKRDLYYLARMYTDSLMLGEKYGKLTRCISISLLDYEFFPDTGEYHTVYRLRDSEGRDLTDLWEIHIIELTKTLKGEPIDDWIRLFNAESEEELDMITAKNEGIAEAINVLKSMSERRPMKALFDDYLKAKRDRMAEDDYIRDEGIAKGRAMGILTILEQKGAVPADIRDRILSQNDETVLSQWLLAAASAEDIETFCEKTGIS